MMRWLEDLFYLVAFVVTVGLVTFSVYDGSEAYPMANPAGIVAAGDSEMPQEPEVGSTGLTGSLSTPVGDSNI